MNSCGHNRLTYIEPVYLMVPRTDDPSKLGRREIGTVACCVKCDRPVGQFNRGPRCPEDFNQTHWDWRLRTHKTPPWYFERNQEGKITPEGESWQTMRKP